MGSVLQGFTSHPLVDAGTSTPSNPSPEPPTHSEPSTSTPSASDHHNNTSHASTSSAGRYGYFGVPHNLSYPYTEPTGKRCLVFISHAGHVKRGFVAFLKEGLISRFPELEGRVFLDDHSLVPRSTSQDNIDAIFSQLADAFVVIVVLTKDYIMSPWCLAELRHVLTWRRVNNSPAAILTVLHDLTFDDLQQYRIPAELRSSGQAGTSTGGHAVDDEVLEAVDQADTDQAGVDQAGARTAARAQKLRATVLQQLATNCTLVREDQANWQPEMRDKLVEICGRLLTELDQMPTRAMVKLPDHLVGMDAERVETIIARMWDEEGTPAMVVLFGMGGLGKTTMAKAVFVELQRRHPMVPCCFLELGACELSAQEVVEKQQLLLQDLAHAKHVQLDNPAQGRIQIAERLEDKVVLLVVDNVWHGVLDKVLPKNIINLLGKRSMLLVTTRDYQRTVQPFEEVEGQTVKTVQVQLLKPAQSEELLCLHAFSRVSTQGIPQDVPVASLRDVARRCGGLPMSLEVLGRYLQWFIDNENADDGVHRPLARGLRKVIATLDHAYGPLHRAFTEQYSAQPDSQARTLFAVLKLSWDQLGDEMQETLLDIVFDLQHQPLHLLEAYCRIGHINRLKGLGLLQNTGVSLPRVQREDMQPALALVHCHIHDLCRILVNADKDRRGLWTEASCQEDLASLKREYKKCRRVVLQPRLDPESQTRSNGARSSIAATVILPELQPLKDLRILRVDTHIVTGSKLELQLWPRWVEVRHTGSGRSSISSIVFRAVDHPSGLPSPRLRGEGLSVLVLDNLPNVLTLEGLCNCDTLKAITIKNLPLLRRVSLTNLRELHLATIEECDSLQALQLQALDSLQQLVIVNCGNKRFSLLRQLQLTSLESLQLATIKNCSALQSLELQGLPRLRELVAANCASLAQLPESLGELQRLTSLEVPYCNSLTTLPNSVGQLTCLKVLNMEGNKRLQSLPESLGALKALTKLYLEGCTSLPAMPSTLHGLTTLLDLTLYGCKCLAQLPPTVGALASLHSLDLDGCDRLEALPDALCQVTGLAILRVAGCHRMRNLPEQLGQMHGLKELYLRDCSALVELPESVTRARSHPAQAQAPGLSKLRVLDLDSCSSLVQLPHDLGNLVALRLLDLTHCRSLVSLPDSLGSLTRLKFLMLSMCRSLQALPASLASLPSGCLLDLRGTSSLRELPCPVEALASQSFTLHMDTASELLPLFRAASCKQEGWDLRIVDQVPGSGQDTAGQQVQILTPRAAAQQQQGQSSRQQSNIVFMLRRGISFVVPG